MQEDIERLFSEFDLVRFAAAISNAEDLAFGGNDKKEYMQMSLSRHAEERPEDAFFGMGIGTLERGDYSRDETEFSTFNPLLRGSYLREMYNRIGEEVADRYILTRARIINLAPRRCYALHTDPGPKIHVALQTTPECIVLLAKNISDGIVSDWTGYHIPADGHPYMVNTTHIHTAINGSFHQRRIHMLISVYDTEGNQ